MASGFNEIPSEIRVPFTYVEFDPTQADRGASGMNFNVLLAGQVLTSGQGIPLTPYRITALSQAENLFGAGSQLAQMVEGYLGANSITKVTAIGINDFDSGAAASGTVTIGGTVTKPNPLCLYIGGILVRAGTAIGQADSVVAATLAGVINSHPRLAVTAAVGTGDSANVVTLTSKHKGETGNEIDLRLNYLEEDLPGGLIVTIGSMSGGAGNPDAMDVVAAMGGERYHVIAWPWTDTANLNALRDELESRWSALRQIDGHAVVVKTGTFVQVCTFASSRNDKCLTVIPSEGSPTLPWVDCAACVGVIAYYGSDDPARPFQSLQIPGVKAPAVTDRWSDYPEKQQGLYEGVSARSVDASGRVIFLALITTNRVNAWGAETQAYLYLNTILTVSYLRYDWNNYVRVKYPRHKLASDDQGKLYGTNQPIMTPNLGRAEAICRMYEWMRLGLVEAPDDFKNNLIVEIDPDNPNRLNWYMKPDLVNQFRIGATLLSHLL
jgi:phage tail sheath gpL-like